MIKAVIHRKIRKAHRWMGVILGIQFFLWTLGGLYFSWSDMDEIHGDFERVQVHPLAADIALINPQSIIDKVKEKNSVNFILDIHLIQILGKPVYQIVYSDSHDGPKKIQLADAQTGDLRNALSEIEATKIAKLHFIKPSEVKSVSYVTSTNGHHEYRELPLPAYAITFDHPSKSTVYISSELGTVQKFRNDKWRIFDFLWMMHTMDYESRDNISNILLRAFSIFGMVTILSGFVLFFVSRQKVIS